MYTKSNLGVMPRAIGGMIEDLFQNGFNKFFTDDSAGDLAGHIPVNIQENEQGYDLQVVAPGLKKEDFKVGVDRNVLSIAYEHKEENTENTGRYLRTEYKSKSFKRSFTLNERIDTSAIGARYADGILHLSLPKKAQPESTTQEINID